MKPTLKRILSLVLFTALLSGLAGSLAAADYESEVTRIYGSDTHAIACKGFDEFYAGQMFVWFQLDLNVKSNLGGPLMNQQVLGDATLKKSVNDKIKMNGLTVKQLNLQGGNPYSAMIAFEPLGDAPDNWLRVSVWLSWGAEVIQDLFKKEANEYFTFELLDGFVAPAQSYTRTSPVYMTVKPVKYRIPLETLEFKTDPTNPNYTVEKESWVKPMFEDFTVQWSLVAAPTPTTPAGTTPTPTTPAGTTPTPTTPAGTTPTTVPTGESTPEPTSEVTIEPTGEGTPEPTGEATPEPTAEPTAAPTGETTPEPTQPGGATPTPDAPKGGLPTAGIILGILGILLIGGGAAYFLLAGRKAKG